MLRCMSRCVRNMRRSGRPAVRSSFRMRRNLRLGYFAHTLRSDWNNGNAHFLRGLMRALRQLGHDVTTYEPEAEWSIDNLRTEPKGLASLDRFIETYADL